MLRTPSTATDGNRVLPGAVVLPALIVAIVAIVLGILGIHALNIHSTTHPKVAASDASVSTAADSHDQMHSRTASSGLAGHRLEQRHGRDHGRPSQR